MGPPHSALLSLTLPILLTLTTSSPDHTALLFKGCADQNLDAAHTQTLNHLLAALTSQSSSSKFRNATVSSIDALFQCRGDLSIPACHSCVKKASSTALTLCKQAVAARIQLTGCYLRYAVSGFRQPGLAELLYKTCGSRRIAGFEDKLGVAMGNVVRGLENGFYAGGYESVYAMGQCEGDLSGGECTECVRSAVERAEAECGKSISGQIYFQECYISYTYYPNGVSADQKAFPSSERRNGSAPKTVAIVMGGLVVVGLVVSCLLYTKSAFKKRTDNNNSSSNNAPCNKY